MSEPTFNLGFLNLDLADEDEEIKVNEVANHDIAIIGMAVKLPLADTPEAFWDNIRSGLDCIRPFPEERREDADRYFRFQKPDAPLPRYLECAFLEEVDKFDAEFFRLTPQEANLTSPAHRLVLETAWQAMEDAGYGGHKLSGTSTGVYLGFLGDLEGYKYKEMIDQVDPESLPLSVAGNLASMIPGRIAYALNLKGPSLVIDTACSSSLVAVDHACRAIRTGSCDMALAGGVRLSLFPEDRANQRIGIESEDAVTRAFDDRSSGSGLGEGVGILLLKPLDKALRDRDSIHAVIKGSAVNQDGTSMGITAPNPASQADVLVQAWEDAGIDPETLSYIEVHGTGTKLGDTIEMDGLRGAFRRYTDKTQFCAVSSVKTNIGHLYESAGIAGLVKTVMALKHQQLPPTIHFGQPNRRIEFTDSPVYVNNRLRAWEAGATPRRAGISSFGISGTNCHIVLEEVFADSEVDVEQGAWILPLSARNSEALRELASRYEQHLAGQDVRMADLCFTAGTGRHQHAHRMALVVTSGAECRELLQASVAALEKGESGKRYYGIHRVISEDREHRSAGEITEQEREQLSKAAQELVRQVGALRAAQRAGASLSKDSTDNSVAPLLSKLCELYIQGADIDWQALYRSENPRRIHLPTYPFKRARWWLDIPEERVQEREAPESFFAIEWKREPLRASAARTDRGPVLLFKDDQGLGEQLGKRYREAGRRVIEVELGDAYEKREDNRYCITGSESDYTRLATDLATVPFDQVVHLFSLHEKTGVHTLDELERSQHRGVLSMTWWTRALLQAGIARELDIVLIAENVRAISGEERVLQPENATLFGYGKVVQKEHPHLQTRCIDLDEGIAVDDLWAELGARTKGYHTAYRAGVRYVEEFAAVDLAATPKQSVSIKADGVYVITGGTGGIGLETARWIASQERVQLVLVNRSKMPERSRWETLLQAGEEPRMAGKIRDLLELELLGATVECISADVTHRESLQRVLEGVRAKFGRIDGIVHGAGVGNAYGIQQRQPEAFQAVFAPKVYGTWLIDELTREDELDFLLLYSSIATMFPATGQSDYTAANAYLDAFAEWRTRQGHKTMAINWATWSERGMAADSGFAIATLFQTLSSEEAMARLSDVLERAVSGVLIGQIHYEWDSIATMQEYGFRLSPAISARLEGRQKKGARKARSTAPSGPIRLTGREQGAFSEIETQLAEICKDTLGMEEINVYDSFFELGADSILIKKMQADLEKVFPGRVAVADIFAYPTIAKLSQFLAGNEGAQLPKREAKKEQKAATAVLDQDVHDLLEQMETGDLSVDQLVDKLFDL